MPCGPSNTTRFVTGEILCHGRDLLLAADETELAAVDALHRLLTAGRIGKSVALRLLRGREIMTIAVVPAARA